MESGVVKTVQLTENEADLFISGGSSNGSNLPGFLKEVGHLRFYQEVGQAYKLHHRSMGLVFFVAR
jgi:hypothetical protein